MRTPRLIRRSATAGIVALGLSAVLPSCGVTRTARKTVRGISTVATLPLAVVEGLGGHRQPGRDSYGYTVRGRRYQVLSHADAHRYCETGTASYYGSESGSRTASGERFNALGMTAAHTTLPFNTRVRVTNLRNGKSVVVRINDRGPFVRGRIIDVSKAAASKLDFRSAGITRVRVEAIGG